MNFFKIVQDSTLKGKRYFVDIFFNVYIFYYKTSFRKKNKGKIVLFPSEE